MTSVPLARPPADAQTLRTWELTSTSDLRPMRAEIARILERSADEALSGTPTQAGLVLVSSELATNALLHAAPPARVTLKTTPDLYVLEVADNAPEATPQIAHARGLGEGGFGLVLACQLASSLGWYALPTRKHVWATFPRRNSAPAST